jgi:predicted O-methyltransferase YrrM
MHQLQNFCESFERVGVHEIKLRNLLELRDPENDLRVIKTMFPPIELGSITLVDQIILLTLVELSNPERILEIGTYRGYSTRLFVTNSRAKEIVTVDLPTVQSGPRAPVDAQRLLKDGDYNDDYLRALQNITGPRYLSDLEPAERDRVKLIKCDSTSLNFRKYIGPIQFAFIDGGHSYDIVRQDTANVLSQIESGIIVWHDYSSAIHSDVTRFLGEYSEDNQLFYVHGGLCAFQLIRGSLRG